jgi:hypothetical protein
VRRERLEVRGGSGEVEQRRAGILRLGQAHADLHAIGQHVEPPFGLVQHAREVGIAQQLGDRVGRPRWRRRSRCRRPCPAARAANRRQRPLDARARAQPFEHRFGGRHGAAERARAEIVARSVGSAAAIAASSSASRPGSARICCS